MQGTVKFTFDIDSKGKPFNINLESDTTGKPSFIAIAINGVKRWRYSPALENGKPVVSTGYFGTYDCKCGEAEVAAEYRNLAQAEYNQRVGFYMMACKDPGMMTCIAKAQLQAKGCSVTK